MNALAEASAVAPRRPGVYFFLGRERDLLYVGKARDLRRRLADHARATSRSSDVRRRVMLDAVEFVSWEESVDEAAAQLREADVIVTLRPAFNAAHAEQIPDCYVIVTADDSIGFGITADPTSPGRVYGTFPHLAKGAFSPVAKATKSSFAAFVRAFDAAGTTTRPAALHDFLTGRSSRLLRELRAGLVTQDIEEFTRAALVRDTEAAHTFFSLAPAHLRALRTRHSLPAGPVLGSVMTAQLTREVRDVVGDFRPGEPVRAEPGLSRRATRERELRARVRR